MTDETPYRVLSLDGGGAKGFYTLGVLKEVEALVGKPLHQHFDLVYGTSTGAIIAALICLGKTTDEILTLYRDHVVKIMCHKSVDKKSAALAALGAEVFEGKKFDAVKTRIGIVTARWIEERPMIFKGDIAQAFGQKASFVPGFDATIGDAVVASCSAYPYFHRKMVQTSHGLVELVDGGYRPHVRDLVAVGLPHVRGDWVNDDKSRGPVKHLQRSLKPLKVIGQSEAAPLPVIRHDRFNDMYARQVSAGCLQSWSYRVGKVVFARQYDHVTAFGPSLPVWPRPAVTHLCSEVVG